MWNPTIETMSADEMSALQLKRFQWSVNHAYNNVAMYREKMQAIGMNPNDIRTLQDVAKVPLTTKQDLRVQYPFKLLATPMRDIVRIHASSGTTGQPITAGYTKNDLDMWAENMARIIVAAGGSKDDIVQIAFGYTLFTGAFGLHAGWEKVGAAVIPISSGNTERQLNIMRDFGTTALVATPSYALYIAEVAEKLGILQDIHLRIGLFGAEASTEEMRKELENRFGGIQVTENYGLTELLGPGIAGECQCKCGMHVNEDHFYPEIINPDTLEVLPYGQQGELVLSTLTKEGQPTLRYRTRDITRLICEPCSCGRKRIRIEKIKGRSDDMLIIRGVNVFPSQIESVLVGMQGIGPNYEIILTNAHYMDKIEVKVELIDARLLEKYGELEALQARIRGAFHATIGLDIPVHLVSPNTLKRFEGKAKRVTDLREKK